MSPAPEPTNNSKVDGRPHPGPPRQLWSRQFYTKVIPSDDGPYIRRVVAAILIAIGLMGFAYTLWLIGRVLLLAFGAILVAVLLNGLAVVIARRTPLSERWSLSVAVFAIAVLFSASSQYLGRRLERRSGKSLSSYPQPRTPLASGSGSLRSRSTWRVL